VTAESRHAIPLPDPFPQSRGHALVVPRAHVASIFDLPAGALADVLGLVAQVRAALVGHGRHPPDHPIPPWARPDAEPDFIGEATCWSQRTNMMNMSYGSVEADHESAARGGARQAPKAAARAAIGAGDGVGKRDGHTTRRHTSVGSARGTRSPLVLRVVYLLAWIAAV
jgi:hypothetical protein